MKSNNHPRKSPLAKSPLQDWHIAHGATIMWDDNYPWPLTMGTTWQSEYDAVRQATGVLDLFSLFIFKVEGKNSAEFIQRTFTNTIEDMYVGQIRYGAFVNSRGIMMDEGNVYKFADDLFLIYANGPNLQRQMLHYGRGLDAEISNITDNIATIGVQGPTSLETLQQLVDVDISTMKFFRFIPEEVNIAGRKGWISRSGYSGEKGYEINLMPEDALHVWESLVDLGAVPFGVEAIEVLRVEAGLMLIYIDYRLNDASPWDFSMDSCIKLHPDCVGTAALIEYRKTLPWRFKTIKIHGNQLPEFHTGIFIDENPVGLIKSPTHSPLFGSIALGTIASDHSQDGTQVQVMIDGKYVSAEVAPLCILDPEKKQMRR